jgi:hypothetical protein
VIDPVILSMQVLLDSVRQKPDTLAFPDVIATIHAHYQYTPTSFTNGIGEHKLVNEAGSNEGSCKVFAFGRLQALTELETLTCFGQFYRDVLMNPHGADHANIRTFMQYGWSGIRFDGEALSLL